MDKSQTFNDVLGSLDGMHAEVAKLLFTEAELGMKLDVGFKGHPALGAAALALLPLYGQDAVWKDLGAKLTGDLSKDTVRVIIVGSVFGGTGASTFYPLALRLREMAGTNVEKLRIAVVALAPYFTFDVPGDLSSTGDGPDARKFPLATRAAAQFYQHLRSTPAAWHYDAMFWLGDDKPAGVARSDGGEHQKNRAHFVDLLAALTCLDYFGLPEGLVFGGRCFYAGPEGDPADPAGNVTTWKNLPLIPFQVPDGQRLEDVVRKNRDEIRRSLLRFALVGAMHLGFFADLFEHPQSLLPSYPTAIPWYYERFERSGHRLTASPDKGSIEALSKFLKLRHFPWWEEVNASADKRVHLLNPVSIVSDVGPPPSAKVDLRLGRLANLLYPDLGKTDLDSVHRFICNTFSQQKLLSAQAADDGAPAYLATLTNAANEFIRKEYPGI